MIKVPNPKDLTEFNIEKFIVPPLDRYTDTRGFMYILFDDIFPEHIKVGRTSDCKKRLRGYNSDKPYRTAKMLYISEMFTDVNEVERKILHYMYDNTAPTTLSKEWFMYEHKQRIIDIIIKAEETEKLENV